MFVIILYYIISYQNTIQIKIQLPILKTIEVHIKYVFITNIYLWEKNYTNQSKCTPGLSAMYTKSIVTIINNVL